MSLHCAFLQCAESKLKFYLNNNNNFCNIVSYIKFKRLTTFGIEM